MITYKFTIKNGLCPETIETPLYISAGDKCMLVFDNNACVGVVWKHYESRKSKANGQAEIRFFDRYANKYNVWHRMFVDRQRVLFSDLETKLQKSGECVYFGKIRGVGI